MCYILISTAIILLLILIYIQYGDDIYAWYKRSFRNGREDFNTYSGLTNRSDTPWTIDLPTKTMVITILNQIMNDINKKTGMAYVFSGFDRLDQDKIDRVTTRFTADFFVGEMRNLETKRLIIIFTLNYKTKEVQVEHVNLSNAMKVQDKVFMDYPAPELILTDTNLMKNDYKIMGMNQSSLEFGVLAGSETGKGSWETGNGGGSQSAKDLRAYMLPVGSLSAYSNPQAIFPSRRQSKCWDTAGINYAQSQTDLKIGINNSSMKVFPHPYENPTQGGRSWDSEYRDLFDLTNSSGYGRGVARSP
jgi:hypothetical protein